MDFHPSFHANEQENGLTAEEMARIHGHHHVANYVRGESFFFKFAQNFINFFSADFGNLKWNGNQFNNDEN